MQKNDFVDLKNFSVKLMDILISIQKESALFFCPTGVQFDLSLMFKQKLITTFNELRLKHKEIKEIENILPSEAIVDEVFVAFDAKRKAKV